LLAWDVCNGGIRGGRIKVVGPEFYRARAAEAMRKAHTDLFNRHIYREIACCYERLAADSDESSNSYSAGGRTARWGQAEDQFQGASQ
jgi:hypothetical protein